MSSIVFEELRGSERFHPELITSHPPFTQSYSYGEWQRAIGKRVRRFVGMRGEECVATLQLVQYPLVGGKNYIYAPYGPVLKNANDGEVVKAVRDVVTEVTHGSRAVFTRLDFFPMLYGDALRSANSVFHHALKGTYRGTAFQPRAEWELDLSHSEDELMRDMHHNTRYSIRAAARREVQVEIIGAQFLSRRFEDFFKIMQETSARNEFKLHTKLYYESVFRIAGEEGNAFLVLARYNEVILAAHFIFLFGGIAHFVFGGSSTEHRDLFGSYSAQWAAIREAKARGARFYSFGGVSGGRNMREDWGGLSSFKRKFGGNIFSHGEFYDVVASPVWYYAYVARKYLQSLCKK
ncbi:MAG: peptidoglycan bridge formation glycyltransferase FemA/FemB family protein [Patescibacteria group bacterium]|nr:peptidoglycan bridge formation glycyltransferase FemA/FemB family protein [Patescibacteria group bacterium]